MGALKDWLAGKKTYLVAAGTIIGAIITLADGQADMATTIQMIIASVFSMTIRAGVQKAQDAVSK